MKLCNPKFGLHSTAFMSSGDNGDSFAFPVNKDQKRCNELEHQVRSIHVLGLYTRMLSIKIEKKLLKERELLFEDSKE